MQKPFRSIDELVELVIDQRGLECSDKIQFASFLKRVNYYRFSGYARQFQKDPSYGDNHFNEGASFHTIKEIMELDARLRSLLLSQLGVVEIAVRALYAHELGAVHGADAFYLDERNYLDLNNKPSQIVEGILNDLSRSRSRMVAHYVDQSASAENGSLRLERYRNVPIWVAIEVLSFGRISNMLEYFADIEPAKKVAGELSVQWGPFGSVMHSFSVLRNLCAHHQQLWHRTLDIQCPVQKKLKPRNVSFDSAGVYVAILMANHYRKKIDGDELVAAEIETLLESNEDFGKGIRLPVPA